MLQKKEWVFAGLGDRGFCYLRHHFLWAHFGQNLAVWILNHPMMIKKHGTNLSELAHFSCENGGKKRGKPLYSLHFYFSEVETIRNFVVCFTLKFSECEAPLISNSFFFHVCIRQSIYPSKGLNIYRFPADGLTLNNIYHS